MTTIRGFIKSHALLSYFVANVRYLVGRRPHRGRSW